MPRPGVTRQHAVAEAGKAGNWRESGVRSCSSYENTSCLGGQWGPVFLLFTLLLLLLIIILLLLFPYTDEGTESPTGSRLPWQGEAGSLGSMDFLERKGKRQASWPRLLHSRPSRSGRDTRGFQGHPSLTKGRARI